MQGGIFGIPPGCDFTTELAAGLKARFAEQPPEALARVTLWVSSSQMAAALRSHFPAPALLPRIRVITELASALPLPELPPVEPALRRRLQLTQLIARLLDAEPDVAPRSALYDLADSLAKLMDEMAGEAVSPEAISGLDVSDHSLHWARTQKFLSIVTPFFGPDASPEAETRHRLIAERLREIWANAPPIGPVIMAGIIAERGASLALMEAVLTLPQGAVVLPGHDFDMPDALWPSLGDALTAEDHPQYLTQSLLGKTGKAAAEIHPWTARHAPDPLRNRLISLALRPAPVTDKWLSEGADLPDLTALSQSLTLIEAPSPRAEAMSIALILRQAAERGLQASLLTPDRTLARQVTVALDRWGIIPDDSAGRPLPLTPPGRLLRQAADLFGRRITGDRLLALLKHPLVNAGPGRGEHTRLTRDLELHLRRKGPAFPDAEFLRLWAQGKGIDAWGQWLGTCLEGLDLIGTRPLAEHIAHHRELSEALCAGHMGGTPAPLWEQEAGLSALKAMTELEAEAHHGGDFAPHDYGALLSAILSERQVRDTVEPHALIRIQGTNEARELNADLVILGGLNDGSWPQLPPPDPWLNRQMRLKAGLVLPERRIGRAAHDFQMAAAGREVILSRAARTDEAEAVPSRWLNRLLNLLQGLPEKRGPEVLGAMRAKGQNWLALARHLEEPEAPTPRSPRPSPAPPVEMRPTELAVTGIETLIRDPYDIYARHILRLRPLDPLRAEPDVRLRGTILHKVMETFAKRGGHRAEGGGHALLMQVTAEVLEHEVPWLAARHLWQARIARVADWFLSFEAENAGQPVLLEKPGAALVPGTGFQLTARPDRIDQLPDGTLHIYDYKTGTPPSKKQQDYFSQQLALQAAMARLGAFDGIGIADVAQASYLGLGATPKHEPVDVSTEKLDATWSGLTRLIATYMRPETGYTARRAMARHAFPSDYDQLSRFQEWDMADKSEHIPLTRPNAREKSQP